MNAVVAEHCFQYGYDGKILICNPVGDKKDIYVSVGIPGKGSFTVKMHRDNVKDFIVYMFNEWCELDDTVG